MEWGWVVVTRPYCVGLTGGIASGKTTVAKAFAARGIQVVDTDLIARQVVAPGQPALAAIVARFGPTVLQADGGLDRARLRQRVFADPASRADLEAILHPLIRQEAARQVMAATSPFVLLVVPLLIEHQAEYATLIDRVLVVDCSPEEQQARLLNRDGGDFETARAILATQVDRATRLAAADDVLENMADSIALEAKVEGLYRFFLTQSQMCKKSLHGDAVH